MRLGSGDPGGAGDPSSPLLIRSSEALARTSGRSICGFEEIGGYVDDVRAVQPQPVASVLDHLQPNLAAERFGVALPHSAPM
jgi:hypothetical protein